MKSVTELSKEIECNTYALSKVLYKYKVRVYEQEVNGSIDGYIPADIAEYIKTELDRMLLSVLSTDQILERKTKSVPIEEGSYIYFLILRECIVYIGQTNQILYRISEHQTSKKEFDHVTTLMVNRKDLNEMERLYIYLMNPHINLQTYNRIDMIDCILKRY